MISYFIQNIYIRFEICYCILTIFHMKYLKRHSKRLVPLLTRSIFLLNAKLVDHLPTNYYLFTRLSLSSLLRTLFVHTQSLQFIISCTRYTYLIHFLSVITLYLRRSNMSPTFSITLNFFGSIVSFLSNKLKLPPKRKKRNIYIYIQLL